MEKEIIIYSFIVILLHQELNIGYYIRKATGQRISKPIKILDCLPCFSFWITLIGTILTTNNYYIPYFSFWKTLIGTLITTNNYYVPMVVFLIFKIYDAIKSNF